MIASKLLGKAAALASQLGNGQPDVEQQVRSLPHHRPELNCSVQLQWLCFECFGFQVACEALGRMPNFQAAVQHLRSLTSRLQESCWSQGVTAVSATAMKKTARIKDRLEELPLKPFAG